MKFSFYYIIVVLMFSSCTNQDEISPEVIKNEIENQPDYSVVKPKVDFYDSIYVKATLTAEIANNFIKFNYTILDNNVHLDIFKNNSKIVETYLDADSAIIYENNNNMFAYNNVYVWSEKSKTSLKTDFLEWNESKKKLFSNKYVKINSPVEIIEGFGFESNQDLTNYKIFKVNGVITK